MSVWSSGPSDDEERPAPPEYEVRVDGGDAAPDAPRPPVGPASLPSLPTSPDPPWRLDPTGAPAWSVGGGAPPEPLPAPAPPVPLALPIVAGVVAAVVAGVVWGLLARSADSGLPALAVGAGLLVGLAMRATTRRDGRPLDTHVIAAGLLSLGAIVLGKYLVFAYVVVDELGPAGETRSVLSTDMVDLFRNSLSLAFDPADIVWAAAAVAASFVTLVASSHVADSTHARARNPVDRYTASLSAPMRVVVDWVVTIVGAVAIVLLVKAFVVNPYRIPSSSMEPTLHCARPSSGCEARISDRVLANRFIYHLRDPRRGEIVVFETPRAAQVKCGAGGTFVKRIVGLPGERLEIRLERGDGYVYINGRKLREPYVLQDRRGAVESFGPKRIPAGHYFMMGDNRTQSCDSRQWGAVPRENLIGKVFATYWPPNRLSLH